MMIILILALSRRGEVLNHHNHLVMTGLAAARVFRLKNNIKTSSLYFDIDDLPVNLMEFSELLQRNQQVNCPRSTGNTANQLHNHSLRWVEFLKVILLL
jgi:hypothetical protein